MRPWVVLALVGCNQVYGLDATKLAPDADERPDLDDDGIADVEDPCLNSEADRVRDIDGDGLLDGVDGCAFAVSTTDSDNDGISDGCDPFPTLTGDRLRCTTTFQSRELSAALWIPRPGQVDLLPTTGALIGLGQGEAVAEGVLGTAPTIVVDSAWNTTYVTTQQFRYGMWLSASPVPTTSSDVACFISNDVPQMQVRLIFAGPMGNIVSTPGPLPAIQVPASDAARIGFRAYLQPAGLGTNVVCYASYVSAAGPEVLTVRGHVDAPLGGFGFFTLRGITSVFALSILERGDMPTLP